jgi:putative hydrolase of the HAD superfamily
MVRAILFDLFETLITESGAAPTRASSLWPELGCEREAFRVEWRAVRPHVKVGRLSFRQALSGIAKKLGGQADDATVQRLSDTRMRQKEELFTHIEPQLLRMVEGLRRRHVKLGVISNCFAEDVAGWPQCALARHFNCAVFSFDVGLAKPDPAIFLEATRRLGVDERDTWFIGDGADDELSGADAVGLRTFRALWFRRRWPSFREEPCCVGELESLKQVLNLVTESNGPKRITP